MKNNLRNLTRILSIIFCLLISVFVLDVFGENFSFIAFIMNLIPTLIVLGLILVSWKNELWGGVAWIIVGLIVIMLTEIKWMITLPIMIIGGLNLAAAVAKRTKRKKRKTN